MKIEKQESNSKEQILNLSKNLGLSPEDLLKQALKNKQLLDSFTKKYKSSVQPDTEQGGTGLGY